jgi:hypothetical protein
MTSWTSRELAHRAIVSDATVYALERTAHRADEAIRIAEWPDQEKSSCCNGSGFAQLALTRDALVRLVWAANAICKLAVYLGQLHRHQVSSARR